MGVGKLGPHDVVVEHLASLKVVDDDFVPVAAIAGDGVGSIAAIFREVEALEGHGAVLAQSVGVEDHARLAIELVLDVEHALVLQSVVIEVVNLVFHIERRSHLGIVGKLGESCFHLVAEWYFLEIFLCNLVLGLYPCCCFGAVVVLEPAIGIGDFGSKVIVDNVDSFSLRIANLGLCGSSASH